MNCFETEKEGEKCARPEGEPLHLTGLVGPRAVELVNGEVGVSDLNRSTIGEGTMTRSEM